jgi:urease accessory protein UreF
MTKPKKFLKQLEAFLKKKKITTEEEFEKWYQERMEE